MKFIWCLCGIFLLRATEAEPVPVAASYSRLLHDLLRDTNKYAPPFGDGERLSVKYGLTLISVKSYDVHTEVAELLVWENIEWSDYRYSWNASEYGIDSVRLPTSQIWTPDLMTYNNLVSDAHKYVGDVNVVVYSSGMITHVPPNTKQIQCNTSDDLTIASCILKVGSWTYSGELIDLNLSSSEGLDLTTFTPNSFVESIENNKAVKNSVKYDCCPEEYQDLKFSFDLVLKEVKVHGSAEALRGGGQSAMFSALSVVCVMLVIAIYGY